MDGPPSRSPLPPGRAVDLRTGLLLLTFPLAMVALGPAIGVVGAIAVAWPVVAVALGYALRLDARRGDRVGTDRPQVALQALVALMVGAVIVAAYAGALWYVGGGYL